MLPAALAAAAVGSSVVSNLMGGSSSPQTQRVGTFTPEQKRLLRYSSQQARNFDTTYQGNAPGFFEAQYQEPMTRQYQSTLRQLQATPERHSSSRRNMEYNAQQGYVTNLGQARADWLNQERLRQMQAAEAAKQRQLGYTQTALGAKAFDTMVTQPQQQQGIMSGLAQGLNLAGSGLSLYQGGQDAGFWGGGNKVQKAPNV